MSAEPERLRAIAQLTARMIARGVLDGDEMRHMSSPHGWEPAELRATVRYFGRERRVEVTGTVQHGDDEPVRAELNVDDEHARSLAVLRGLRDRAMGQDRGRPLE